jgi:hypothetical protein
MELKNKHTTISGAVLIIGAALNVIYVVLTDGNITSAMEVLGLACGGGYGLAKAGDGSL